MEQQGYQRQCAGSNIHKIDVNCKETLSKDDINVTFSSEKKIVELSLLTSLRSSVFNSLNESKITSLNSDDINKNNYEQVNFLKMCRDKLDRTILPADFDQWTIEHQYDHLTGNVDKYFPNVPVSLRYMVPAMFEDGDCGRLMSERPDWLDMDKFRRGQAFAQRSYASICMAQFISLFMLYSFNNDLKTIIMSQKSNTPYRAFRRFLSTVLRVSHWYQENPWAQGTRAHQDIKAVRKMHLEISQKLCSYDNEQINARSRILHPYTPMHKAISEDFRDTCPAASDFPYSFTMIQLRSPNQASMSGTQFGFMGLIVLYPEKFGLHNTCDEDLEAFCHMWRGLGYLLGIEDRYNFCRGSLQDVRRRCSDFLECSVKPNLRMVTAEWEHMVACVQEGINYIMCVTTYKVTIMHLCDILNLKVPRIRKSLSWLDNIIYVTHKIVLKYLTKIPLVVVVGNMIVRKCIKSAENFGPERHAKLKEKSREIAGF